MFFKKEHISHLGLSDVQDSALLKMMNDSYEYLAKNKKGSNVRASNNLKREV